MSVHPDWDGQRDTTDKSGFRDKNEVPTGQIKNTLKSIFKLITLQMEQTG